MEEMSLDVMVNNKELFQRNINGVLLHQSRCGMHAKWYYLHGKAMVVTTNCWPDAAAAGEHWDWLQQNTILLRLNGPTWIE